MLRLPYLVFWLALLGWAVLFAPADDGLTGERVQAWLALDGEPTVVAVFNMLGVWPLVMAGLVLPERSRLWAWPFVLMSMGLGFFILAPYLILRDPDVQVSGAGWRKWAGHRAVGVLCLLCTTGLCLYAATGSLAAFVEAWQTIQLVNIMSMDFIALWCASIVLVAQDARRRGGWPGWGVVPLFGPAVWLTLRPGPPPQG